MVTGGPVVHRSFPLGATRRGRAVRREVVVGRLAATESALHHSDDQNDGPDSSGVAVVADPSADVAGRLASQEDVRCLRDVADELTGWIAWKWLLARASDGDDPPGFSLRRPRDVLTVALRLLVTVVGGVGYVGFKLVQACL